MRPEIDAAARGAALTGLPVAGAWWVRAAEEAGGGA